MSWMQKYVGMTYGANVPVSERRFCWDFVRDVFSKEQGIALPEYKGVYALSLAEEQQRELAQSYTPVSFAEAREWDLVWEMIPPSRIHVGIVTKRGQMIHCGIDGNVILERYDCLPHSSFVTNILRVRETNAK